MIIETVLSPIRDEKIQPDNIKNSLIWKECYHLDEMTDEVRAKHNNVIFEYIIKFEGLTPIMLTKMKQV